MSISRKRSEADAADTEPTPGKGKEELHLPSAIRFSPEEEAVSSYSFFIYRVYRSMYHVYNSTSDVPGSLCLHSPIYGNMPLAETEIPDLTTSYRT